MRTWAFAARAGLAFLIGTIAVSAVLAPARAEQAATARLSRVVKEVKLTLPKGAPRAASMGDVVPDGATLRTGAEGDAEMTLPGPTVMRLGGKTILTRATSGEDLMLDEGLVLFAAPRSARNTIRTGTINLETRGSTGMIERFGAAYVKIVILEGDARVYTNEVGESLVLTAGQLLITSPKALRLPEPVHFNIEHLYQTSLLINSGFAPLPTRAAILRAIAEQKSDPRFVPTNLVIFGRGTLVNLLPPSPKPAPKAKSGFPSPTPKPKKP